MLRRTALFLSFAEGERPFTQPCEAPINNTGGVPFYGNIYAGRIDSSSHAPPPPVGRSSVMDRKPMWEDPTVMTKIDRCPYFALCDQVLFHNMDPAYLDPGLLNSEEHHLMLLYSRAYYEKWKEVHQLPPNVLPMLRIRYGRTTVTDEILELLKVPPSVSDILKKEFFFDDASLIAMNPDLWRTAYLDPFNMDHFSGRVLEFAGVSESVRQKWFLLLKQMRRLRVERRDVGRTPETIVVPFSAGVTLHDLYRYLQLPPYSGALKVYNYFDIHNTQRAITLMGEDAYFDFLVATFYRGNLRDAMLCDAADDNDCTARYTITVEPYSTAEKRIGRWF